MSIDSMLEGFKDLTEVKAFAEAQTKTIIELNKKNKKLEEEVLHLKKILEDSTDIISNQQGEFNSDLILGSDEETIAKIQLNRLKEVSFTRELTLEEAKRTEIFTKILALAHNKPTKIFELSKDIGNEELLKLVDDSTVK